MFIVLAVFFIILVVIIRNRYVEKKEAEMEQQQNNTVYSQDNKTDAIVENATTKIDVAYPQDDKTSVISRSDNKPISNEEIPSLIELGYKHAIERENKSQNISLHRTQKEEDLSFNFEMNHGYEIGKYVDAFEKCYRLAMSENDLCKKIELLEKTISNYEKSKAWFYRTKGGTIYFQDMYEHLHNSRNDDFSYIDQIKDELEECIEERDFIIPKILEIIKNYPEGILQKDIYQHLPDISRTQIQKFIRNFEREGLITREQSKGSYLLTIKKGEM